MAWGPWRAEKKSELSFCIRLLLSDCGHGVTSCLIISLMVDWTPKPSFSYFLLGMFVIARRKATDTQEVTLQAATSGQQSY